MEYITDEDKLELNVPYKAKYKDINIVIYKTTKGLFALEDRCSHEEFPLSESTPDDGVIECKKHGSRFDLESGSALTLPAVYPVKTFKVIVRDGSVFIED